MSFDMYDITILESNDKPFGYNSYFMVELKSANMFEYGTITNYYKWRYAVCKDLSESCIGKVYWRWNEGFLYFTNEVDRDWFILAYSTPYYYPEIID